MPRRPAQYTIDLFDEQDDTRNELLELQWPDAKRFPLNLDAQKSGDVIWQDLLDTPSPLIITGYAGLNQLIDFIAETDEKQQTRIVLGFEPFASHRDNYRLQGQDFTEEMQAYWLEQGLSLLNSAKVVLCKERLQQGKVLTRYVGGNQRLHAKIFIGDDAATLGSSNFTLPGLKTNLEANARFSRSKDSKRYKETVRIAENYWQLGHDYNDELIALLDQLLQVVSWQEALARACAELLEGDWAARYIRESELSSGSALWPSQKQGIAQALYILSRQDSVLVADATGSGKTRMGVHLVNAVVDQILRSGRLKYGKSLMVCPPAVETSWKAEAIQSVTDLDTYSHGVLSHTRSQHHELMLSALRRAQVLCVDEGHNFLNVKSNRTKELLRNMADHVLLFTATPINRSVVDLLRIVDMLGADNLEPDTLKMFNKLLGKQSVRHNFTDTEAAQLRREIRRFTVRRTKHMLNTLIQREPEKYTDYRGKQCCFPKHKAKVYNLNEPKQDRLIASQIRQLAEQISGVTHFTKTLEMPEILRKQGRTEENYLAGRLVSARHLARYMIMSSLRSSRLALVEHIVGTDAAVKWFKLHGFTKATVSGNIVNRLDEIAGKPPKSKLSVELPDWLYDAEAHEKKCVQDRKIYEQIFRLTKKLSDQREKTKAGLLVNLLKQHKLVLAFDSRPITLAEINRHIKNSEKNPETMIATGDKLTNRDKFLQAFKPGSELSAVIGLCSDSLSEGVNLQQASAITHLDMPSVVRIAEQRVGRVDRMDSPHKSIEAWWPQDAEEFALSSDDKFIERFETVESLLGSNLPLPETMQSKTSSVSTQQMIKEFEKEAGKNNWDGISDAFENVRKLVDGEKSIVAADIYETYRHVKVRVLSRVSLVSASKPWAFFCITAGMLESPRWVFIPSYNAQAVTELDAVVYALRASLTNDVEDLPMSNKAATTLQTFIRQIAKMERSLLSRKKQRALEEMHLVLKKYIEISATNSKQDEVDHYTRILDILTMPDTEHQPDWDEVAARWLDIIRPIWYEVLNQPRTKPLLLKDIRKNLYTNKDLIQPKLFERFMSFPVQKQTDKRVLACIIGVA